MKQQEIRQSIPSSLSENFINEFLLINSQTISTKKKQNRHNKTIWPQYDSQENFSNLQTQNNASH